MANRLATLMNGQVQPQQLMIHKVNRIHGQKVMKGLPMTGMYAVIANKITQM
jgi:hypothetical protein